MKSTLLTLLLACVATAISGCYTDTVDAVSTFDLQVPIQLKFDFKNKQAPDTATDHVNLLDYAVYRDNQADLHRATAYQLAFWIDSLKGSAAIDDVEFKFIEFHIQFPDGSPMLPLARFDNVKASEFYKNPHIYIVPGTDSEVIARMLKTNPSFSVIQRYSETTNGPARFDVIVGKVDIAVRLEVDI